jgi:hypothetical protein
VEGGEGEVEEGKMRKKKKPVRSEVEEGENIKRIERGEDRSIAHGRLLSPVPYVTP